MGENNKEYLLSSMPIQTYEFSAIVKKDKDLKSNYVLIEQRNRFKIGDELEVLSPTDTFNQVIVVEKMITENDEEIEDASLVQQTILLKTSLNLKEGDILRKKI